MQRKEKQSERLREDMSRDLKNDYGESGNVENLQSSGSK